MSGAGKGDGRRPTLISSEENDFRWALYQGTIKMSDKEADKRIRDIRKKKRLKR